MEEIKENKILIEWFDEPGNKKLTEEDSKTLSKKFNQYSGWIEDYGKLHYEKRLLEKKLKNSVNVEELKKLKKEYKILQNKIEEEEKQTSGGSLSTTITSVNKSRADRIRSYTEYLDNLKK